MWYLPDEKVKKSLVKDVTGESMNDLAQFAGPEIIAFGKFPRPFSKCSFIELTNISFCIPLLSNISDTEERHCILAHILLVWPLKEFSFGTVLIAVISFPHFAFSALLHNIFSYE